MAEFANRRALWLAALAVSLFAAPTALRAQEYSFRYFGTAEGLGNMSVLNIYQDRIGFLWLTTENGIYRFDGERFEGYGPAQGIPMNAGTAFGEGPDGSLLAGGDYGLYRLVRNRFLKIPTSFHSVSWLQGIASDGQGNTYLGTDEGLVELVQASGGYKEHLIPQPAGVTGKAAWGVLVKGDTLWWGCGEEVCRKDRKGVTVLGISEGVVAQEWEALQVDRSGTLWVRGGNAGEYVRLSGETKFHQLERESLLHTFVYGASLDSDERVLLPSASGLYLENGDQWQRVDQSAGLFGTAYAVLEDRQHRLWIGMASRGLAQWQGYGEWEKYSAASGLTNDVIFQILPLEDGSIWVGTDGGLFHGVPDHGQMLWKYFEPLSRSEVTSLLPLEDGVLLVGTGMHGMARVDTRRNSVKWFGKLQGLGNKTVHVIRFDRNRRLWVATGSGVYVADYRNRRVWVATNSGRQVADSQYSSYRLIPELGHGRFWSLVVADDGTIWAGGEDGLFAYTDRATRHWTQADGLSNQEINAIAVGPDGAVWIGYRFGGGIDRLVKTATGVKIERGVERPGTDGRISFLDFDSHHRLWAGTERGVDTWNGQRWTHYGAEDGLAWNDCNLNGFAETPDGAIWIGTGGGLSRFKPRTFQKSDAPAAVVFTALRVGRDDVSGMDDPAFAARNNSMSVRFAVLDAPRQNQIFFRYRLNGSAPWAETAQHELQFAGLAPGTYRLEVEARDEMGNWSLRGAVFPFNILSPWYLSWWATLLYLAIPVAAIAPVLRLREMTARNRERELRQQVAERTNDLKLANEELLKLSHTDALTGLANRRVFDETLARECARLQRAGMHLSLVIFDADLFKALNDSAGHQWGDTCLTMLAGELAKVARRPTDLAARIGGEEFALLLPDTDLEGAFEIAEAARLAVFGLHLVHPNSPVAPWLTLSAGVATATLDYLHSEKELVAAADHTLYDAKRTGRNCVKTYDPENRHGLEQLLRKTVA
jgi:diguanylate cyclase (GGDEF)-like protein